MIGTYSMRSTETGELVSFEQGGKDSQRLKDLMSFLESCSVNGRMTERWKD